MGGRSWIVILSMGVASVVILGFLTKFAIESSPDLQSMIRFKAAFASDFQGEGVSEVSLRKSPKRRGHQLLVTLPAPQEGVIPARLEDAIAVYFVKNFEQGAGSFLEICYQSPGSAGCSGPTVFKTTEVALAPVRLRVADQDRIGRLDVKMQRALSCRVLAWSRDARELRVDVAENGPTARERTALARSLEGLIREEFRQQPYYVLRLRWRPYLEPSATNAGQTAPLEEVRFDGAGKEIRA